MNHTWLDAMNKDGVQEAKDLEAFLLLWGTAQQCFSRLSSILLFVLQVCTRGTRLNSPTQSFFCMCTVGLKAYAVCKRRC